MRNKRGQFYFLAALIIILIIISFVSIANYSSKSSSPELWALNKELEIEKSKILEYIAYGNLNEDEAKEKLTNFAKTYSNSSGNNKNIIFLIATENYLKAMGYKTTGSEIINITSGNIVQVFEDGVFEKNIANPEDLIIVNQGNYEKSFELREGQNFYYLVSKEYNKEKQIISG